MYQLTSPTTILRLSDSASIPADPQNVDFAEYLAWCEAGNTPEPYVVPEPTVKEQLAKLDADNALTQRNLRDTILLMTEAIKVVSNNTVDLSVLPGVANVVLVEQEAARLRALL